MDYFIFGEFMSCFIDFIDINLLEKYTLTNLVSEKAVDQSGKGERLLCGSYLHSRCVPFTRPAGVREYEKRRSRQLRPMPNRYMTHKERRVFLQPFKCYKNTRHETKDLI